MSLREAVLAWRDRLLIDPSFARRAASFPPTRTIARRNARALFDLCAGFVYSQILLACVRLDLFQALAGGPRDRGELAAALGLSGEAADRLLRAAVSLRLVDRRGGGRFGLGTLGAAMVANPSLAAMVEHHRHLYADLGDPVALLRAGGGDNALAGYWPYVRSSDPGALPAAAVGDYTELMAATQEMIAAEILDAVDLGRFARVMDLGGGDGAFVERAASRCSGTRFVLFDLPPVAERARDRFARAGLAGRVRVVGGDFFRDSLPGGSDAVTLIRVIHDHDEDAALRLLRNARASLSAGGTLVVAEPLAECAGAEPVGDAYFGFYLMAMGSGRPRTKAELFRLLGAAGFRRQRLVRTNLPILSRVITARRGRGS